ncbi:hypothetical protein LF817_19770 [Halobacillus sp. A1]|uniref:hypothetical protein n=1 Tax=Halobacillus sp. A1 TaxID=2880262 RepID=UPI0020A6AE1D|nr:hypothetical protein [Halobacillus sp. A1]MCP3033565.1 hypothetical protein [Halobacillus sp. A1]
MVKISTESRLNTFYENYGVESINLIIDRHELSKEKRQWFAVRFASDDQEFEKECTKKMNELSKKIEEIDVELENKGIDNNLRTNTLKQLKKIFGENISSGFVESDF